MAINNVDSDDDRYYYSGRDSHDSPIISYRYEKHRRSGVPLAARCFLLSAAMIVVCVLMYIPMYYRADIQPRVVVGGWGLNTPRDTALYVRPYEQTVRIQPRPICPHNGPPLLLIIVVCSATTHFERRLAIRQTWGDYNHYLHISTLYNQVRDKYKNYNYTYDLDIATNMTRKRQKRNISGFSQLLPALAKALQSNLAVDNDKTDSVNEVEEKRFDNEVEAVLPEFDMDKELGGQTEPTFEYEYESNVMRIPLKGYEDSRDLEQVRDKYKNYNYTYDLDIATNMTRKRQKRNISGFSQLLPALAKALQSNLAVDNDKTDSVNEVEEKRFDNEVEAVLPEFDMDKELGGQTEPTFEYEYESNVMRIPLKGYEDSRDLEQVLKLLKRAKAFTKLLEPSTEKVPQIDFRLVFLLGLGAENDTALQKRIESEAAQYGDVIQEDFRDSYNNLTLKSIMMLKWINDMCNHTVRYILKTDDDMYINVPALVANVKNRSLEYKKKVDRGERGEELVLAGDLICGARPVIDATNKWYSPRYMFDGAVYPHYVSGTGYLLSFAAAQALYNAALQTPYFHLEDVYITGMCAMRAHVPPTDDAMFSYVGEAAGARGGVTAEACHAHAHVTTHRVAPADIRALHVLLRELHVHERCEIQRLQQVRRARLRTKKPRTAAPERGGLPRRNH